MACRGKAITGLVVAVVLLLSGSAVTWSTTIADGDPNTIGEALSKSDGSTATLTCEQVLWRGKSGQSFAIKEWFEKSSQQPRLIIISTSPLLVEPYWSVDITGIIQTSTVTLPTGATYQQRVMIVSPENVRVYYGSDGKPCPFPLIKGFLDSKFTMRSLASSADITGQFPLLPDTPDTPLPSLGSRDNIKSLPDGAVVSINGAITAGSFNGRFTVQRSDRSSAIWVHYPTDIAEGSLVNVVGSIATEGDSRYLIADSVTTLDTNYTIPEPIGMNNRDTHNGLDTTGLLVRLWGNVTSVDSVNRIFYINDGSHLPSSTNYCSHDIALDIKVYDTTTDALPSMGNQVAVNGLSGYESSNVRTLYKYEPETTYFSPMSLALPVSGTGKISGTITAIGADGKAARVYCGDSSTIVTFSGNTANYSLVASYGRPVVTVSIPGYKTITTHINLNSSHSNSIYNVALPVLNRRIDFITEISGSLTDGTKETTITAILRDEEGRRISNSSITWNISNGVIYKADLTTDIVGEAKAVIRCNHGTVPMVEACADGVTKSYQMTQ